MKYIKLFENYNSENFYLAVDDYKKIFENEYFLNTGKIKGLKGISTNSDIMNDVGGTYDIFIEMNKKETLKLNNLLEFDYKDENMIVRNNFEYCIRIMGYKYLNALKFITSIFTENFLNKIKNQNLDIYDFLLNNLSKLYKNDKPYINDLDDLCQWIIFYKNFDYKELYHILKYFFINLCSKFEDEKEWFVLNEEFIIPKKSNIEIYFDNIYYNIDADLLTPQQFIQFKDSLKKIAVKHLLKYNVKFL